MSSVPVDQVFEGRPLAWRPILAVLTVAAGIEALVLRTVTRTFVHIPGLERFEVPLRVVAEVGRAGYYLAAVLVSAALATLLVALWRRTEHRELLAAVVLFAAGAVGVRLLGLSDLAAALATVVAVVLLSTCAWRSLAAEGRAADGRVAVGLFAMAFVLAGLHTTAQFAASEGVPLPIGTGGLLVTAEIAAVAGALLIPRVASDPADRIAGVWGGVVAVIAFGGLMSGGANVRILMLWNLGLGGWLPDLLYAVAAGALTYTAVATWRSGRGWWTVAILLLTCGGIGLHSTYQSALVVTGLAVLALRTPVGPSSLEVASDGRLAAVRS